MRLSRSSLAVALLAAAAWAQMASRNQKVDVLRVGARIACQCGCKDTVASCGMLACHFSGPAKEKIAKMQTEGVADPVIIDSFVKEYGQQIFRSVPNAYGWVVPYVSLAIGTGIVILILRRARRPRPAVAGAVAPDPGLERYTAQIEKELEKLD
ncbi:MAG: cytochrome c-type biogenesis protein CcmH [Bryobacteraceae bacterium]